MEYTLVINWVILDYFKWPNFKIFFNHGEGMDYTLMINWVILDYFRWPNFKNFFNHGEGMEYTLVINWVILDYFRWPDFKKFLQPWWRNGKSLIRWVTRECFKYENSILNFIIIFFKILVRKNNFFIGSGKIVYILGSGVRKSQEINFWK